MNLIDEAERAVRHACALGISSSEARKLVRVEMHPETEDALIDQMKPALVYESLHTPGIRVNGVTYYTVRDLEVPWRVIGLGRTMDNRLVATVREAE